MRKGGKMGRPARGARERGVGTKREVGVGVDRK